MGEVLNFALFVVAILGGVAFFGSYVIPKMERWAEEQEKLKSQKKNPQPARLAGSKHIK